jgi:pyridoxine kinase
MFSGFTIKDLQDQIEPIASHWKSQNITFDAIYTGYLANKDQIRLVRKFFEDFGDSFVTRFVDPAMADNGSLYTGFDDSFVQEMASLCGDADIIVPNLTEACLMTGTEYRTDYSVEYIYSLLTKLADLGTGKYAVITGVSEEPDKPGFVGLDVQTGQIFSYSHDRIDRNYHGTGDIFASVTIGALIRDYPVYEALKLAADFTRDCVYETMTNDPDKTYGVDFEAVIPSLVSEIQEAVVY